MTALTRKFLEGLGIEDENVTKIVNVHFDTVNEIKKERDNYKADADKLADVQKELDDLKAKGDGGLQKKYDDLKKEFDDYKNSISEKETLEQKKTALKEIAKDSGLSEKGIEKALKYADYDKIELDENGKVKDAKEHMKNLKSEWAEYVVKSSQEGAEVSTPPSNNGGTGSHQPSRAQMVAQKYYSNIYGIEKKGESK